MISAEDLGGARVHTQISGGADHFCRNQDEAIERVREILSLEPPQKLHTHRYEEVPPRVPVEAIYEMLPANVHQGINVRALLEAIADDSHFVEYKKITRPGAETTSSPAKSASKGFPVGVIASNGIGIIFAEAARKATEWIIRCCQEKTPAALSPEPRRATWWDRNPSTWASANTARTWCGRFPAPRCPESSW